MKKKEIKPKSVEINVGAKLTHAGLIYIEREQSGEFYFQIDNKDDGDISWVRMTKKELESLARTIREVLK
jgi:hypothetical protein